MYAGLQLLKLCLSVLLAVVKFDEWIHYYHLKKSTIILRGFMSDFEFSYNILLATRIAPSHLVLYCLLMSHKNDAMLNSIHAWGYQVMLHTMRIVIFIMSCVLYFFPPYVCVGLLKSIISIDIWLSYLNIPLRHFVSDFLNIDAKIPTPHPRGRNQGGF